MTEIPNFFAEIKCFVLLVNANNRAEVGFDKKGLETERSAREMTYGRVRGFPDIFR